MIDMKKFFKSMILVAVATIALAGCKSGFKSDFLDRVPGKWVLVNVYPDDAAKYVMEGDVVTLEKDGKAKIETSQTSGLENMRWSYTADMQTGESEFGVLADKKIMELSETELAKVRLNDMGFIFQQFHLIDSLTIGQNVELPLLYKGGVAKKERERLVNKYLDLVTPYIKKVVTKDYDLSQIAHILKERVTLLTEIPEMIDFIDVRRRDELFNTFFCFWCGRVFRELLDCATKTLCSAKEAHDILEKFYVDQMDFDAASRAAEKLAEEIF